MKYLKQFNEAFRLNSDLQDDINDILIELKDENYKTDIDYLDKGHGGRQEIMISVDGDITFNSNDIKPYLIRLIDYINLNYEVINYNFAVYRRYPTKTLDGINTFTTDTKYYDHFPENLNNIESIGIDILIKSNNVLKYT